MAYKMKMKKKNNLKGKQTKLDANKDGKIGKEDFAMLRNKKKKVMAWLYLVILLESGREEHYFISGVSHLALLVLF